MTVLRAFAIEFNHLEAAEQEYDLAKEHYQQVLKHRNVLNPDHQRRFRNAQERLERAREAYLRAMLIYG